MNNLRKNKKLIVYFILLINLILPFFQFKIEAHNAVFLRSVIDTSNFRYIVDISEDKPGSREENHLEAQLGNFSGDYNLISKMDDPNSPFKKITIDQAKKHELPQENDGESISNNDIPDTMIFTFPTKQESSGGLFSGKNDATAEDTDRAFYIGKELSASLNGLLSFVNSGRGFSNIEHLMLTSLYIRPTNGNTVNIPGPNNSEYQIVYTNNTDNKGNMLGKAIKTYDNNRPTGFSLDSNGKVLGGNSNNNSLNKNDAETYDFIYAMPKGYMPTKKDGKPLITTNKGMYNFAEDAVKEEGKHDTPWITIHHLTSQANFAYKKGATFQTGKPEGSLSLMVRLVTSWLLDLLYGLMNLLGLYNIEELVFNKGIQGSQMYSNGIMSAEAWKVVVKYNMIFQGLAAVILIGAVVKILIQANYSTINPAVRMHLYKIFEKMFAVTVLLVGTIPIFLFLAGLNNSLVDIFATQVDLNTATRMASHGGMMAGIIIEYIYFAITIYMNFVYIMRKIVIAILLASAPLFIISMAFSYNSRGFVDTFFKELIANIFIQSFHAFTLAFILNLQVTGRTIESLVSVVMLIPLTEFFRSLIFKESGGFAIQSGKGLSSAARGGLVGAGAGLATGLSAGIASQTFDKDPNLEFDTNASSASIGRHPGSKNIGANENLLSKGGAKLQADGKAQKALDGGKSSVGSTAKNLAGAGLKSMGAAQGAMGNVLSGAGSIVDGDFRGAANSAALAGSAMGVGAGMVAGSVIEEGSNFIGENKNAKQEEALMSGEFNAQSGINPITNLQDNGDGTNTVTLSGKKLNTMGIDDMALYKNERGQKEMTIGLDSRKFAKNIDPNTGKATPSKEAVNFAKLLDLQDSANNNGQAAKQTLDSLGIKKIESLGQGRYKMHTTEKYTKARGYEEITKSPTTGNTQIIQNKNADSSLTQIPEINDSQYRDILSKDNRTPNLEAYIGGKTEDGNISEGVFNQNFEKDKFKNFEPPNFNLGGKDNPIDDGFNN